MLFNSILFDYITMCNRLIVLLALAMLLVPGCITSGSPERIVGVDYVGDGFQILSVERGRSHYKQINYTWGGRVYRNWFDPRLQDSLDWIKGNTIPSEIVLCWWDYGHMIRGYTGRDVVVGAPSEDIMHTVASGEWGMEYSRPGVIRDVASAYVTDDSTVLTAVMEKYNATYFFVSFSDMGKLYSIAEIAGSGDSVAGSLVYTALRGENITGMELVYNGQSSSIYKIHTDEIS